MTNRTNPRRGDTRHTEHGSHWENSDRCDRNPSRSRQKWKRLAHKAERRTGKTSPKFKGRKTTARLTD